MINKKYMYGQLNKESSRVNYGGLDTDSLKINVDNDNMLISGDVQWQNMLGNTADKAYPGDEGTRNYRKILDLAEQLQVEIARSTSMDEYLQKQLLEGLQVTQDIQGLVDSAIQEERSRSEKEEADLRESIARGDSDNRLLINKLEESVQQTFGNRKEVDDALILQLTELQRVVSTVIEQLTHSIEEEKDRSIHRDNELNSAIAKETARAQTKESELEESIEAVTFTIEELNDKIDVKLLESTSASKEDLQLLTSRVEDEIHRSKSADNALQSQVSNHEADVQQLKLTSRDLTDKVSSLDETIDPFDSRFTTIESSIASYQAETNETTDKLQHDIDKADTKIDSNFNTLNDKIDKETIERLSEICRVDTRIDAITIDLPNRITALEDTVADIPTNVDASLSELQRGLDSETEARESVNRKLLDYVDKKVDDLRTADEKIEYKVDHMGSTLSNTFVSQINTEGEYRLYSVYGTTQDSVVASAVASANTVVLRSDDGQIELPVIVTMEDIEAIGKDQAVSKNVVKILMGSLEEDYNKQLSELRGIKFIDGGNAPI